MLRFRKRGIQRNAKVFVIVLHPLEPSRLIRRTQALAGAFRKIPKEPDKPQDGLRPLLRRETLRCVLTDRLQHPAPYLLRLVAHVVRVEQRALLQVGDCGKSAGFRYVADFGHGGDSESTAEETQ